MRLPVSLILTLLLSSCSTYTYKVENKSVPMEPVVREPSSSESEENLSTSFEIMMNSADPVKEMGGYLDRLKSIFMRTETYLSEFDQELDEAVSTNSSFSFESSKSYKKLLVMYALNHRLQDKISFHYLKLTDMAYDKSLPGEKRKMAKQLLLSFKKKLDSKDPVEKITYDQLKTEIANDLREHRGMRTKSIDQKAIPSADFKDEAEKVAMLRSIRKDMRMRGKAAIEMNDELNQKIERDSENLQLVDQSGREPQSEKKFFASTGTNGNIMGLIFPKNVWALTFDDGPNPVHTAAIVKNMDELDVKPTFFWLAQNVIKYQSMVELVKEKGMARANHSWSHAQLPKLDAAGLQKEIVQSTEVEAKSYGEPVKFFRCPYGAGNSVPRIRKMIADLDMIHVFWNVDTLDWQDKDPDSIVARAKKQMQTSGHGVVLFHDIHPQSVIASKKLVEWTKTFKGTDNEIRWVSIPEIVNEMNGAQK